MKQKMFFWKRDMAEASLDLFYYFSGAWRSHPRPKGVDMMGKCMLLVFTFFVFSAISSFSAYVGVVAHIHLPEDAPAGLQVHVSGSWNFGGGISGSYATSSGGSETLVSSYVVWTPGDETVIYMLGLSGNLLNGRTVQTDPYVSVNNIYSNTSYDDAFSIPQHFPDADGANGNRRIHVYYYVDPIGGSTYPEEPSGDSEDGSTAEPIDTKNGNNYFVEKRISVPCPGIPLEVDLKYQSVADLPTGTLGKGWRHSLEWVLDVQTNQAVLYTGTGKKSGFDEDGSGGYLPPYDKNWTLEKTATGYEVGIMPGGLAYAFNTNGVLSTIHDAWGNGIECSYGTNGCMQSATHSNGRQIVFSNEWHAASSQWRTASISVQGGMSLAFDYNGDGQFTQVVEQVGANCHTSEYQYAGGFLTKKINEAGFEYTYEYETGTNGLPNGKGIHLDVDGYYKHDVAYVYPDTTDVRYSLRGTERVYRYVRDEDGILATKHGPGESVSEAMTRGIDYAYSTNNVDRTETTLFNDTTGATWSEWMLYDGTHNITNYAVSYCTSTPAHQLSMDYDSKWQLPAAVTDAEGNRIEILYTNGSPLIVKAFYSSSNSYDTCLDYATNGLVGAITNANGHVVDFDYDFEGNLICVAVESGPVVANTYDSLGFVQSVEVLSESGVSTGRIVEYDNDCKGQVERITYPDGLNESFAYNAVGYLTNLIDRAGRTIAYTYAPTERLTSITRYLNEGGSNIPVRIGYDLDEQANLLRIGEPRGRYVESYKLDIQDRVTSVTNIEGQVMNVEYGVGNFVKRIDRFGGNSITNTYDNVGRKTNETIRATGGSELASIDYSYYADGELRTVADGTSAITNQFDRLNRLTNLVAQAGNLQSQIDKAFDPVGNTTNTVISVGSVPLCEISYVYDAAERLTEVASHKETEIQRFIYCYSPVNGLVESVSNTVFGMTCSYEYDLMDRITNITYCTLNGSPIRSFGFEYNAVSMIMRKTISGETTSVSSYAYDSLDRLVYESISVTSAPPREISYSHDFAGNRTGETEDGLRTSYTLGIGNRLAYAITATTNTLFVTGTANEPIGTDDRWGELWITNFTSGMSEVPSINGNSFFAEVPAVAGQTNTLHAAIRDLAGNMGYATKDYWVGTNGGTTAVLSYDYDAAGCLTNLNGSFLEWDERYRLTLASSTMSAVSYAYDVLDRRVSRIEGVATNYFIYDGRQVVADLDENGDLIRSYVWGVGIDNLLCFTDHTTSNTYYAIKDHQNSLIALVNDAGTVVESYEYDAYGNTKVFNANRIEIAESALGNRYCFHGREIDWDTGLYYFRARWYDSSTGRWLSKDPVGIGGGLNQYAFCVNNPANFIDPLGLDVAYLNDSDGAAGFGHAAAAVGNDISGWTYYSFGANNPFTTSDNLTTETHNTYADMMAANPRYGNSIVYPTDSSADANANRVGNSFNGVPYNFFIHNCDDVASQIVEAAGIDVNHGLTPDRTFFNQSNSGCTQ